MWISHFASAVGRSYQVTWCIWRKRFQVDHGSRSTDTTMGKSQKKRTMRRHNPMRVPDSHLPQGLASAESASTKRDAILPIIQKVGPSHSRDSSPSVMRCRWRALTDLSANGLVSRYPTSYKTIHLPGGYSKARMWWVP